MALDRSLLVTASFLHSLMLFWISFRGSSNSCLATDWISSFDHVACVFSSMELLLDESAIKQADPPAVRTADHYNVRQQRRWTNALWSRRRQVFTSFLRRFKDPYEVSFARVVQVFPDRMIEDLNVADIPLLVPLSFPFIVSADRAVETLCFFIQIGCPLRKADFFISHHCLSV
nr:MAG TPA: hypothetical protein [Caudoviricetes sp.]